eukprot:19116-Heterococcus_DN1.PRE.1
MRVLSIFLLAAAVAQHVLAFLPSAALPLSSSTRQRAMRMSLVAPKFSLPLADDTRITISGFDR